MLGWLSSWLADAGPAPVQPATKKPMPNFPSKGVGANPGCYLAGIERRFSPAKGPENLSNGSQTRYIQVLNSSMRKFVFLLLLLSIFMTMVS